MECGKDLAVGRNDLCGKLAVRVLEFLKRRDVGKCPYRGQKSDNGKYSSDEKSPEPSDDLLLYIILHIKNFL